MAENVLETRIQLRYGTYSQWMNSDVILKQGEAAICAFPQERVIDELSNTTPINTPPAIGIKIGDGYRYFYQLPWVQAVAADVYRWAKSETKPTYTASEISGLQSFIEDNFHLSGDITISPRIYQIVQGTGADSHKYYLQYKENNEEGEWIVDTNHAIDLSNYFLVYDWIGAGPLDNFNSAADFINYLLNIKINTQNYSDTPVAGYFVTSVSEENGIIEVTKDKPSFSNLSGTASVEQGGTGRTSFPLGEVLVGNDNEAFQTIQITDAIDNSEKLVTSRTIKQYVDEATANLTGAMHFIGEASVVITAKSSIDPKINGYNFGSALPGDVILSGSQEYVWDGGQWVLLGDEGSYAVKGSIRDADIDAEAEIQQSKIAGLEDSLNRKVDKEEGKVLSSNDFTDELRQKLEEMGTHAETNVIEHILLNGVEVPSLTIDSLPKTVSLQVREFSETAQTKLATIEQNAQVNKIEKIIYDGTEITPDINKVVTITPDPHTEYQNKIERIIYDGTELIPNEDKTITITSDPHTEHINKIEGITVNGTEYVPDSNKNVNIIIDQAALNLNVLEGAIIPGEQEGTVEVPQTAKKLELARIAVTGDVKDLSQTADTYIILDCGSSTTVI